MIIEELMLGGEEGAMLICGGVGVVMNLGTGGGGWELTAAGGMKVVLSGRGVEVGGGAMFIGTAAGTAMGATCGVGAMAM